MKTLLRRLRGKQKSVPPVVANAYQQQLSVLRQQIPDATDQQRELIAAVQHLTMTSPERILALINAVDYLATHQIEGDFVECGVWKGGSMVATANTLIARNDIQRRLWLYDTFEGMSEPTDEDVDFMGQTADRLLGEQDRLQVGQHLVLFAARASQISNAIDGLSRRFANFRSRKSRRNVTTNQAGQDRFAAIGHRLVRIDSMRA